MVSLLLFALLPQVVYARLPDGGMVPSVYRNVGLVSGVAYGKGQDAYFAAYSMSPNRFSEPVRINSDAGTVVVGGERGPKLAGGDCLHAVWQGPYRAGPSVWYSRTKDGGRTWLAQRNLVSGTPGLDEPTIAAHKQLVVALWLDGRDGEDKDNPVALPIYYSLSKDGGESFGPNTRLKYDFAGTACSCCSLDARFTEKGVLEIAFRTGYKNIRNMWWLRGDIVANRFVGSLVWDDKWFFEGCPMDGPRVFGKDIAWMSDGRVYYSLNGGNRMGGFVGKYPSICGDYLIWEEGKRVHWRSLTSGEEQSEASNGMRSGVLAGTSGRVYILN